MPRFKITFRGRKNGAIGITTPLTCEVEAPDREAAILKLYDTHEHIHVLDMSIVPSHYPISEMLP